MIYANDTLQTLTTVTADNTSETVDIRYKFGFFVAVNWTSTTAAGVVKLQQSPDGTNWFDHATTYTINNNSSSGTWAVDTCHYGYMRVFLDYTSGSVTTFNSFFSAKGSI